MRKSVRVLILMLMLFTSLTAGTLASIHKPYRSRACQNLRQAVRAGRQPGQDQDEFDLKIGPGELVSYQFAVTNENAKRRMCPKWTWT